MRAEHKVKNKPNSTSSLTRYVVSWSRIRLQCDSIQIPEELNFWRQCSKITSKDQSSLRDRDLHIDKNLYGETVCFFARSTVRGTNEKHGTMEPDPGRLGHSPQNTSQLRTQVPVLQHENPLGNSVGRPPVQSFLESKILQSNPFLKGRVNA